MRTWLAIAIALLTISPAFSQKEVLTSFEYRVTGQELRVSPVAVAVPKGIAGSVNVELFGVDSASPLRSNTVVEATLRGPAGPAQRVIGTLGQPLLFPPLSLVGDYQLDGIRLARVEGTNLVTVLEGSPSSVPVRVFDEVLVSRVTSRPLTSAEIEEKGIFIDEANFRAVEFEVGFVLDGKTIPVRFPVVTPQFRENTEIIPAAELEERLAQAESINQEIGSKLTLPPELESARLNIQVQAINFQPVDGEGAEIGLKIPAIPALLVIPGNIGFLNQFFSVQLFTENAAPRDSGLSVINVRAQLELPFGPDQLPGTFETPLDDPLRFARVGPNREIRSNLPVTRAGPDGEFGTSDDIARLLPGEAGQAEFLVEGLQEGLHTMDVKLTADLEGLAAGVVKISGKAAGSVLVRNPNFSLAFSHPRTVRFGEPYDASVTILNTSATPANRVRVTLPKTALSGMIFEGEQQPTVEIGDLGPGQSGTARFRLRAQRTGQIKFSNLTTSDDASRGVFNLTMGFDERGVGLSPDTILLPDLVTNLPLRIRIAADRVLGQAISVATAGRVPPGVLAVPKSLVTRRALDLAEAGQRLLYSDTTNRVLMDLLLDWQGGREFQIGWDQILRETDAGSEWREALMAEFDESEAGPLGALLGDLSAEIAGRSESWLLASFENASGEISFSQNSNEVTAAKSAIPGSLVYGGTNVGWLIVRQPSSEGTVRWRILEEAAAHLNVARIGTNGIGARFDWSLPAQQACYNWTLNPGNATLNIDLACDGAFESSLNGNTTAVAELPPVLISARQDLSVLVGRPDRPCPLPSIRNYANVVAALFSKPMHAEAVHEASAYTVDGENGAAFVQIQPGGRVALLTLRKPIGGLIPRSLTVGTAVTDPRGNGVSVRTRPIIAPFRGGVNVSGRVIRADGTPAANVPVTLTYLDEYQTRDSCADWTKRVAQTPTDSTGRFEFDFVLGGIEFVISATDTSGLSESEILVLLESTVAGQLNKDRFADQLQQAGALSGLFDANSAAAIAKAEGVDRAAFTDLVDPASRRAATLLPVVLTFRGRGTVTGRVLSSDGVTPISNAAVNLFADPDSRELGRGLFSGADGRFSFFGVPLGVISIEVTAPSGAGRIISDALTQPGQVKNIDVILSATLIPRGSLAGRILETDNVTPHAGGTVFIKRGDAVIRSTKADAGGVWQVDGLQAGGYNVVAFSDDNRRFGLRNNLAVAADSTNFVEIVLNGTATVRGRVLTAAGDKPVANALVAGGDVLVRTDTNGFFTLTGVPTGRRSISAGVERSEAGREPKSNPAFDFPRFGSGSLEVLPGADNFVIIQLTPAAKVFGRVRNADNTPKPFAMICQPVDGGFFFVTADEFGKFVWENLPIGERLQFSVPGTSPPINNTSVPSREDIQSDPGAALVSALETLFGVNDPFLNGTGADFNPDTFDEEAVTLLFDGDDREIIFQMRPKGTVSGRVLNGQDVPIGAAVRVTGEGLSANMAPTVVIRGDADSDPQTGEFSFSGVAVGNIQLQAASPFFPSVITQARTTTSTDPNATNVILKFPPARETHGRLAGRVFEPNGITRVGEGVKVAISFGDHVIQTDTNGVYDTRFGLPAPVTYTITATNLANGLVGQGTVLVNPTGTNDVKNFLDIRLLGKGGLNVRVLNFDGSAAPGAFVKIRGGAFPREFGEGVTDLAGAVPFAGLSEGGYAVEAELSGATKIYGRSSATVVRDAVREVIVRLEPTASISGRYVLRDGVTPVRFAQIAIGSLGFANSDADGRFNFAGVPLGTYRILSSDPVTGRAAKLDVTFNVAGEVRQVLLVEQSLGEIAGAVINSFRTGTVPNATVNLSGPSVGSRTVTTGPDGRFSFLNVPAGAFTLSATDPAFNVAGSASGTLADDVARIEVDVVMQALGQITVQVWRGSTNVPGTDVRVTLGLGNSVFEVDTDANGRARFPNILSLGSHNITAISKLFPDSHNGQFIAGGAVLSSPGTNTDAHITLPGIGEVRGRVLENNGVTGVGSAFVFLTMLDAPFQGTEIQLSSEADGSFVFRNVAVGRYSVRVQSAGLAAQADGVISAGDEIDNVTLILFPSGTVIGRLFRADGITAVRNEEVGLSFTALGSSQGRASATTDSQGRFGFSGIPLGTVRFNATIERFGGVRNVSATLSTDGQILDLGDLFLDEELPAVVSVTPLADAIEVPTTTTVDVLFSEPLDPQSINRGGVYLRTTTGVAVPASVALLPAADNQMRLLRLTPTTRLQSKTTYQLVIIENNRPAVLDLPAISGPTDLEGRFLGAPFLARFTTADNDPPILLSIAPTNNKEEVEPTEVIRLSFNEPIRETGFSFVVTGPQGNVPGIANVGFGGLVLVFSPATPLAPNGTYQFSASGVRDLAGNLAAGEPFTGTFHTLDLVAPAISVFRIADNLTPVAGRNVQLEVLLSTIEPGALVRFEDDSGVLGIVSGPTFRVPVTLPTSGSRVYRAVALDRFRNESTPAAREIVVTPNQPPVVTITRIDPVTGPAPSGSTLRLNVSASDDVQVTNLTVRVTGFISLTNIFPNGATRSISIPIPLEVPENSSIQIVASARDFAGLAATDVSVNIPLQPRPLPQLSITTNEFELVEGIVTNLVVSASHIDGGLARLELDGSGFNPLVWTNSNSTNLIFSPAITETNATVQIAVAAAGTNEFIIRAFATNDLPATLTVRVIGLGDLDRDTIPDRDDPDIDGDNLSNSQELTLGTDPRKRDTDGDTLADDIEVSLGTNPLNIDTDGDGAPDNVDSNPLVPAVGPTIDPIARVELAEQTSLLVSVHAQDGDTNLVQLRIVSPAISVVWQASGAANLFFPQTNDIGTQFRVNLSAPIETSLAIIATDFDGKSATSVVEVVVLPDLDRDGTPDRDDTDVDGDGLNNTDEIALGTDPRNRDTDDDGLLDGADPRPLVKNLPPTVASDSTLVAHSPADLPITISASDPNADPLQLRISKLPEMGRLFQTSDGATRGALITTNGTVITHPEFKIIFSPPFATNKTITFSFIAHDGALDSSEGTNTVAVTHTPGADSDNDGMPDFYEVANNLNPEINDGAGDADSDGLTNLNEFTRGLLAGDSDTDNDFLNDGAEITALTNPLNPDTDGDGILDGLDPNPLRNDSDIDSDGIADQDDPDMDNDGLLNTAEITRGTDPRQFDTDTDGWPDGLEVEVASDPLDPLSKPSLFLTGNPLVNVILPAAPPLALELLGVTVSEPVVGVILPTAPTTVAQFGITISEPSVNILLPIAPTATQDPNSITISGPVVQTVLPAQPTLNDSLLGLTVSDPVVAVILPISPELTSGLGITISEPAVGLVLPVSPELTPGSIGITISEPVVTFRLDVPPTAGDGAILTKIEVIGSSGKSTKAADAEWQVKLSWSAPDDASFIVESSPDLIHWSVEPSEITRTAPGQFRAGCELRPDRARFYRVIQSP